MALLGSRCGDLARSPAKDKVGTQLLLVPLVFGGGAGFIRKKNDRSGRGNVFMCGGMNEAAGAVSVWEVASSGTVICVSRQHGQANHKYSDS